MKTIIAIIALNAAIAAGAIVIQDPDGWFSRYDSNGDGQVTRKEYIEATLGFNEDAGRETSRASMERRFSLLDRNKDGVVTMADMISGPENTFSTRRTGEKPTPSTPDPASGIRNFLSADGQSSTRGKVLNYDHVHHLVTIQKNNRKKCRVGLECLSEPDQIYVREWGLSNEFSSESKFRITVKQNKAEGDSKDLLHSVTGVLRGKTTTREIDYEIILESRMADSLSNVRIEYCIYYEQEGVRYSRQETNEGVEHGILQVGRIEPHAKVSRNTGPIRLQKIVLNGDTDSYSGIKNVQNGRVIGIWVQVHLPLSSGAQVTRHYCKPTRLKEDRVWFDRSVPAGINRS